MKIKNLHSSFLPERVRPYWNKLPTDVKSSEKVLSFKIKLEAFKKDMISKRFVNYSYFWNVSKEVLGKFKETTMLLIKKSIMDILGLIPMLLRNILLTYIVVESTIR